MFLTEEVKVFLVCAFYISILVFFLSMYFPTANIFFQLGIIRKYKKVQYESEYFRNILTYSPSEIYYIYNKNFKYKIKNEIFKVRKYRKLFLINLLKMDVLKYITIDFPNKHNFKITKNDVLILDPEYKYIMDYIFGVITSNNDIYLYEIYDYINENYEDEFFEKWDSFINQKISSRGFYDGNFISFYGERMKKFYKFVVIAITILSICFCFVSFTAGILFIIMSAIILVLGYLETKRVKVISASGIYEYRKIIALKRFLKHFSTMDQRFPEYVKILDDYVVYASIFDMLKDKIYTKNIMAEIDLYLSRIDKYKR